jgi:hypothetical protein
MSSEFDNQASKILRENIDDISAERWSDEWDTTEFSPQLKQAITEFENELTTEGGIDVIGLKDIVDEIHGANVLDDDVKEQAIGYLRQRAEAAGLEEFDLYGEEGIFSDIDGEIDEFNKEENRRERARDRGREAEDKGDWDEWNRQENKREAARDKGR